MKLYSVHLPAGAPAALALERAAFVKSGFSWSAFLVTPIWAIWRRLWLALGLWFALLAAIAVLAAVAHIGAFGGIVLYYIGAMAFGLEAERFRQSRLAATGYLLHGLALGGSVGDAEAGYFAGRGSVVADSGPTPAAPTDRADPPGPNVASETDLLGLFPSREDGR
jgi:hypothetical protein